MKNIRTLLFAAIAFVSPIAKAQNIELSFFKLDENEKTVEKPQSSNEKDKLLAIQLFGLEGIKNYEEISCVIQTNDFHVDEYTFPFAYSSSSEELYNAADVSKSIKPGTKYTRLLIVTPPADDSPEGIGQLHINFTRTGCGYKYLYSREGCANFKEYTLTAKVIGQNYQQKYDPQSDMYYKVPSHDPVTLSNIATIKITTSPKVEKQAIELTIGKKSDLFDAIKQGNEKVEEMNGDKKKKN